VEPFILHLLQVLEGYGEVQPGKKALWAVLETARERVGVDKQARIDLLHSVINGPGESTGAPAASGPSAPVAYPGPVKVERTDRPPAMT
jgi:hypothetical protein